MALWMMGFMAYEYFEYNIPTHENDHATQLTNKCMVYGMVYIYLANDKGDTGNHVTTYIHIQNDKKKGCNVGLKKRVSAQIKF